MMTSPKLPQLSIKEIGVAVIIFRLLLNGATKLVLPEGTEGIEEGGILRVNHRLVYTVKNVSTHDSVQSAVEAQKIGAEESLAWGKSMYGRLKRRRVKVVELGDPPKLKHLANGQDHNSGRCLVILGDDFAVDPLVEIPVDILSNVRRQSSA